MSAKSDAFIRFTVNLAEAEYSPQTVIGPVLVIVVATACFWSTAVVEIGAVLLVLNALVLVLVLRKDYSSPQVRQAPIAVNIQWALALWITYELGVLVSFIASGIPFSRHPGLVWHPLLVPAILLTPTVVHYANRIGIAFLFSAICSAAVTLVRQLASSGSQKALAGFVGVTTYADLLALAVVVAAICFAKDRSYSKMSWAIALAGVMLVLALFKTFELAPIIVVVGAVTLIIYTLPAMAKLSWLGLIVIAAIAGPSIPILKVNWLIHGHTIDRFIVWEEGTKLLWKAPFFGYGPGSYLKIMPAEIWTRFANRPPGAWHNDILQTALDNGIITSFSYTALIVLVLYQTFRTMLKSASSESTAKALGLLMLCLVSFGLIGNVISTSILGVLFWIVLGLNLQINLSSVSTRLFARANMNIQKDVGTSYPG